MRLSTVAYSVAVVLSSAGLATAQTAGGFGGGSSFGGASASAGTGSSGATAGSAAAAGSSASGGAGTAAGRPSSGSIGSCSLADDLDQVPVTLGCP